MLSRLSANVWIDDDTNAEELNSTTSNAAANYHHSANNIVPFNNICTGSLMMDNNSKESEMGFFFNFKFMLQVDDDWYLTSNSSNTIQNQHLHPLDGINIMTFSQALGDPDNLLLHSVDSSSSCSPSSSVFNNLHDPSQVHYFMQQPKQTTLSSLLNVVSNDLLEHGFDLSEIGFPDNQGTSTTTTPNVSTLLNRGSGVLGSFADLSSSGQISAPNLCGNDPFSSTLRLLQLPESSDAPGFTGFEQNSGINSMIFSRSKLLRPLETFPPLGAQPTLFQKRAALRKNLGDNEGGGANLGTSTSSVFEMERGMSEMTQMSQENDKKIKFSRENFLDDVSIDGSGLNCDSDDFTENTKFEEIGKNGGSGSNANSGVTGGGGDGKGKKCVKIHMNILSCI